MRFFGCFLLGDKGLQASQPSARLSGLTGNVANYQKINKNSMNKAK
jgi:hypothetical protein